MNNIGALWISKDDEGVPKKDKKGNHYMTGEVTIDGKKVRVMLFKNNKTKESQPDYQLVEKGDPGSRENSGNSSEFSDDIPF